VTRRLRARAHEAAVPLIGRCSFPDPGSPLACAVSGGADSLALLLLAVVGGCDVVAHHVDHGLREDSYRDVRVVNEVAAVKGAQTHLLHIRQAACRRRSLWVNLMGSVPKRRELLADSRRRG
jgi:tRNA(Ile)-lysidine synthase TilS/MesJ